MNNIRIASLVGVAAASLMSAPAWAQASGEEDGTKVAEIIVTAQKRDERLQDVPVAVTAVSSSQLEAANIENVLDLNLVAPSLNTVATNGIYLGNTIRGVGSLAYGAGVESPVGLYVDGVYQAAPFAFSTQLNNVASVEVLKGPQGTLFGRNATGGLINIKTAVPGPDPTAKFSVSYGNYQILQGDAYVSAGLGPNLAADIAFSGKTQGKGFGFNPTTGRDWDKLDHNIALRSKWLWTPGSATTITLIGDYFEGSGTSGGGISYPGKVSGYTGRIAPDLGWGADSDLEIQRKVSGGGVSLQLEQDFGGVTLNSISAYRESKYPLLQDIDFTPQSLAFIDYSQKDRQLSQEFQLSSDNSSNFKWTVGLFYFDLKSDVDFVVDLTGFPFVAARFNYLDTVGAKSYAAYGQGTYALGEDTNLTVGLRYTSEKRSERNASLGLEFVPGVIIPITYPDRTSKENKLTYRVSLDHRFSDEVMVYASLNTGFKSGGFNSTAPGEAPYLAEKLTAYEVGIKSDLFDRRLRANISGFYYDYKNVQVQRLFNDSLFIINGPAARIYGLDADFTAALADGLTFSGGVTWIDPKFKQFLGCPQATPAGGVPLTTIGTDCTGNQLPFAAKFNFSGALNYTAEVGSGKLDLAANIYYNSGYFFEPDNILEQTKYAMLGASAKYKFDNGLSIGLFGRNLTNKRVIGYATHQANGNASLSYQEPRTYGVTLGFEF